MSKNSATVKAVFAIVVILTISGLVYLITQFPMGLLLLLIIYFGAIGIDKWNKVLP